MWDVCDYSCFLSHISSINGAVQLHSMQALSEIWVACIWIMVTVTINFLYYSSIYTMSQIPPADLHTMWNIRSLQKMTNIAPTCRLDGLQQYPDDIFWSTDNNTWNSPISGVQSEQPINHFHLWVVCGNGGAWRQASDHLCFTAILTVPIWEVVRMRGSVSRNVESVLEDTTWYRTMRNYIL